MIKSNVKKRITQADVAHHAGVSQAMVSYVINKSKVSIPQETRQRIQDSMHDLGYTPNVTAQRLRTNKSMTIAGVIPDITNPFYPTFERGIQEVVDEENYDFIIYNTDGVASKEKKVLNSLLQGRVDGIVGSFFHLSAEDLRPLVEQGIAVVRLEQPTATLPKNLLLDTIYINSITASKTAVDYLTQKRHKRIGVLASQDGPSSFRVEGYEQALSDGGIEHDETLIRFGPYNEEGGYEAMKELLNLQDLPTAIFAVNDLMAMGAMLAIREAGLSVPDDIAVIGFDDIPSARLIHPSLTSISQRQKDMGRRAATMLFERLRGEAPNQGRIEELPFEFIIRNSS